MKQPRAEVSCQKASRQRGPKPGWEPAKVEADPCLICFRHMDAQALLHMGHGPCFAEGEGCLVTELFRNPATHEARPPRICACPSTHPLQQLITGLLDHVTAISYFLPTLPFSNGISFSPLTGWLLLAMKETEHLLLK
jgi:hypothetical protein